MSKLSKQALKVDNNTSFPNNNTGYITPAILRAYNDNIIDSMVDEIPYAEYTQSVAVSIEALNAFTASAQSLTTGSLLITASAASNVITFTKGDGSQFNVTVADTTDLSSLNAFTASATISITALNANTASQQVSINALNVNSASVNSSIAQINAYTASNSTASIVSSITQLNAFSASALVSISNLNTTTASLNTSVTNLNSFSASQLSKDATLATYTGSNDTKWSNLGAQSGSWITESETGSFAYINKDNAWSANQTFTNITAVSASFTYVKTLYETSSVIYSSGSNQFGDASNDVQTLYGSTNVVNELTASGLHYPTADNGASSFLQTDGAGNLSFQYVDAILEEVRYGENISIGDPLYVSGSNGTRPVVWRADAAVSAKMPVIYIATSTAVANTNTSALTLGNIEGVTTTGYPVGTTIYVAEGGGWTSNRPTGSSSIVQPLGIVTKEGAGGSGRGLVLNPGPVLLPNIEKGYLWVGDGTNQPIAVSTSSLVTNVNTGSLVTTASFNAYTASNDQKVNSLIAATGSYATTGSNIFVGNQTITGSFSTNGGATIGNTSAQYNSVNIVTSKTNFPGNVYNAFNINTDGDGQWSAGLYVSSYNGFGSEPAAGLYGGGLGNAGSNNILESYGNLVRINKNTELSGSLAVSASLTVNGSPVVVSSQTGSFIINTGSFATTGSNAFFGTNSFSGAVEFTGSAPTILSSSFSGSIITNLTDIYTEVPAVKQIVTLTSASYAALSSGSLLDPNTLYVVSGSSSLPNGIVSSSAQILNYNIFATTGSNNFNGNQSITGSLTVSGSTVQIYKNGGNGLEIYNSGLDSQGTIIGRNNIQALGQYANMYIMQNGNYSGSQYPGQTIIVAPNTYPTDIYGGLSIATELGYAAGATFLGVVANSYSPQYSGTTVPMIIANGNNPAGNDTAIIWTSDGSAEHYKKSRFKYSIDVTGSLVTSGSFVLTGSAAGNVVSASITSNTASIDFSKGNYFELTSSVTPLHLNVTNITPGTTSTLIISASASSSILFSPNVAQPSGSAYSGSAGSIDILSLVSFNSSKVNVVSTKALV